MSAEFKVRNMNQWMLLLTLFGVGASITRFLNGDKLFAPFRDRIEEHFTRRGIDTLRDADAQALVHPGDRRDYTDPEAVQMMRVTAYRQAFLGSAKWRKVAWRLDWCDVYKSFVGCPWCVSFWVFLVVFTVGWASTGAPYYVWGGAFWVMIPCFALVARWVYGLIAGTLDHD